jgi:hypothetical protein
VEYVNAVLEEPKGERLPAEDADELTGTDEDGLAEEENDRAAVKESVGGGETERGGEAEAKGSAERVLLAVGKKV